MVSLVCSIICLVNDSFFSHEQDSCYSFTVLIPFQDGKYVERKRDVVGLPQEWEATSLQNPNLSSPGSSSLLSHSMIHPKCFGSDCGFFFILWTLLHHIPFVRFFNLFDYFFPHATEMTTSVSQAVILRRQGWYLSCSRCILNAYTVTGTQQVSKIET